LIQFNH